MKIVFATNNQHKIDEVQAIAGAHFTVQTLREVGFEGDIPETMPTIAGNSLQKAQYIFQQLSIDCFADDTGLEIEALDGAPGVYSARYAGEGCSFADNVNKVLQNMEGSSQRNARFISVFTLILNGEVFSFEGVIEGTITEKPHGAGGFGYDPIFIPKGYDKTFAELSPEVKNEISHRAIAATLMFDFLKQRNEN